MTSTHEAQFNGHGKTLIGPAEILCKVFSNGFLGGEVGKDINESEHFRLEVIVSHTPFHDLPCPEFLIEKGGRLPFYQFV